MPNLVVASIYDKKAEIFLSPQCSVTIAQAVRTFEDLVKNPNLPFGSHPEDYDLFALGHFDDSTGIHMPLSDKYKVASATDFIKVS